MAFAPSASWNSRSITHLANYPSRSLPTNSSDEPHFLARHLTYHRRNSRYHLSQMILALMYPIVLGLDRLETASFLRSNGTFQFLTGLPSFPDPADFAPLLTPRT